MKKLFVGGINFNTTEDVIKNHFSKYGNISQLRLIRDHQTGKSRGFAFITFENDVDADNAKAELDGSHFDGRIIGVKDAREKR